MRRRRTEVTVELRKCKREETLQKRRNVPSVETTAGNKLPKIYSQALYSIGCLKSLFSVSILL